MEELNVDDDFQFPQLVGDLLEDRWGGLTS